MLSHDEENTIVVTSSISKYEASSRKTDQQHGVDPKTANAICYVLAAIMFILTFNIPQMPDLPFSLIGSMLPASMLNYYGDLVVVILILWGLHFIRRFSEVLFLHSYSRKQTYLEAIGASIYYGLFGMLIGWACNYRLNYFLPHPILFYPGIVIFAIGEVGNCAHHVQLKLLKPEEDHQHPSENTNAHPHILPTGLWFKYVSCPHYFFEIITWIGFFFATFVLPALLFVLATSITLVYYSRRNHLRYLHQFPDYPTERKALIPFLF